MKKTANGKIKVLVAMSGGVDSSVVAAILHKNGYDVMGAFMRQWSETKDEFGVCSWREDRREALRVAAHLGIPLVTLDFEKEYKNEVVSYMISEYAAARTPNPDVLCNERIKFGVWLEWAKKHGFDYLATGHYASVGVHAIGNKKIYSLLESRDKNKDQTYFLHRLNQDQLSMALFPIGKYTKPEVRRLAKKFGLPTAEREESMGICFIGEVPMKDFLQKQIAAKPGNIILHNTGEVVGTHDGLPFYTLGQRHLNVEELKHDSRPLFVVAKNSSRNELVLGYENDALLNVKMVKLTDVTWTSGQAPKFPLHCQVRLRHRQQLETATVSLQRDSVQIDFKNSKRAPTPGQFAVFYKSGECLGGGIIH